MSRILVLDRGNHSLKAALSESGTILERWKESPGMSVDFLRRILNESRPEGVAFSSVVPKWTELLFNETRKENIGSIVQAGPGVRLPFELLIKNPVTVGPDRLCAACGAVVEGCRQAVIVDMGTAVTVDLLTVMGFVGGAIFPGLNLLVSSLNDGTAALPRIDITAKPPHPPGSNTRDAIAAGTVWGMIGAVNELVRRTKSTLSEDVPVFLTGGLAGILEGYINGPVSSVPDLVFNGLIWIYHNNEGILR